MFIGRIDVEAETPVVWSPDANSWLIWKDLDAGKDWRQEEKGMTEDEMAGWHHRLNGHEFEWSPGVSDGQGGLACCSPWGCKESVTTERLNWIEKPKYLIFIKFEILLCVCVSCLVVSDSLWPTDCSLPGPRLLCPWNFPGRNTGVGCHYLSIEILTLIKMDINSLLQYWLKIQYQVIVKVVF